MKNVARFDRGLVKKAIVTDEGYLRADAIVTRTGVFTYINADGTIRKELRHPDDVFKDNSLESMKMRPITDGHPPQKLVDAKNFKELSVGYTGESVNTDGRFIVASMMVTDSKSVNDIRDGRKRELSLGYTVDLEREDGVYDGQEYTHRQTNIIYNHLAIVDRARAGSEARIHLDGLGAEEVINSDSIVAIDSDYSNLNIGGTKIMDDKFSIVALDGLEYKAAPEVANAFKKFDSEKSELNTKIDSLTNELDKLKAEKDELSSKLDEMNSIDHEAKLKEAVKSRVSLLSKANEILGKEASEINMDEMSDRDIKVSVIKVKRPKVNLDEANDTYIEACFDLIVEDSAEIKVEDSESLKKQREALSVKSDAEDKKKMSSDEAFKAYVDRLKNGYKMTDKKDK